MGFAIFVLCWITLGWLSLVTLSGEFNKKVRYFPDGSKKMSNLTTVFTISLMGPIMFGFIIGWIVGVEGTAKGKYKSTKYPQG